MSGEDINLANLTNLISHDHELAVSKIARILVVFVVLQTKNLLDILDLLVLHDLVVFSLANVQQLSTQREDTVVVATDDTKTRHSQGLGRVSFRQNESTVSSILRPSVVGVR